MKYAVKSFNRPSVTMMDDTEFADLRAQGLIVGDEVTRDEYLAQCKKDGSYPQDEPMQDAGYGDGSYVPLGTPLHEIGEEVKPVDVNGKPVDAPEKPVADEPAPNPADDPANPANQDVAKPEEKPEEAPEPKKRAGNRAGQDS